MIGDGVTLDRDGSWECQHAGRSGEPAPATRLRIDGMAPPNPGRPTSTRERITCPDCGTLWRVWTDLRVAKPAVEWSAADTVRRFRRAPVLDIDRVIDVVAAELPDLSVVQHHDAWPADDEGVWFFRLPHVITDIQLESSTGMCPFTVEHSGMPSAADAWSAASIEEAAQMVVGYLRAEAAARGRAAAG
jgi:hypothetical protein